MKKRISLILSMMLILSAVAFAQADEPDFKDFAGLEWEFSSGVGAWANEMQILEDGSFAGVYHDSEMGEADETYPDGTIYCCAYTGKMSLVEKVNEYAWKVRIDELTIDGEVNEESIDEGIRFITAEPYGLGAGDELLLYRPGTPVSALSEEMHMWAHIPYDHAESAELDNWFLSNEARDAGFLAYSFDNIATLPNPWLELESKEQLLELSGIDFNIPEGAEEIVYRYLPEEALSEILFILDGDEYCARIEPAALNEGELMNISDIYFAFENEEAVKIRYCDGTIGLAQTGSEDWVELCLWYDIVPGIMYSLSVYTTDPDGLDLTAVAEQVYLPVQGDA